MALAISSLKVAIERTDGRTLDCCILRDRNSIERPGKSVVIEPCCYDVKQRTTSCSVRESSVTKVLYIDDVTYVESSGKEGLGDRGILG